MKIPKLSFILTTYTQGLQKSGNLVYNYANFYNLLGSDGQLKELKIDNKLFGASLTNPIDIEVQPSYDGSVNLILNDDKNKPKLINSRFIVGEDNTFDVADRNGDIDTNIYNENYFEVEAGLLKVAQEIPTLTFNGVESGGKLSIGNYTFYFKYADADGNETDFVSESGKVVCYIGTVNEPESIRGGLDFENSQKLISFTLNNIDLSFPYIKVYYTINTGNDSIQSILKAFVIKEPYKVKGTSTKLIINGYEDIEEVSITDINSGFQTIDTVKTQAQVQNMLFLGNITNSYSTYEELKDLSLRITPRLTHTETIGNLDPNYQEIANSNTGNKYEYYNPNNIYYRLGYWDEEIYRLGIVYIMNDYSLSPVFNIRGVKELTDSTTFNSIPIIDTNTQGIYKIKVNDNYSLEVNPLENAKGVFKINSNTVKIINKSDPIKPIGLGITIPSNIMADCKDESGQIIRSGLQSLTKGFFVVRQPRIPDIIAQTIAIAKTKNGNIPVLKNSNGQYFAQSFLTPLSDKNTLSIGSYAFLLNSPTYVETKAALCPEASVRTSILNNFFNSSNYKLRLSKYQGSKVFDQLSTDKTNTKYYRFTLKDIVKSPEVESTPDILTRVTLVEPGIDLTTNGIDYFSSKAGDPYVAYKAEDIKYGSVDDYTTTDSQADANLLSKSPYLIRGEFNTYLGVSQSLLDCHYYNIYQSNYDFNKY
jgi:hypothetical protein